MTTTERDELAQLRATVESLAAQVERLSGELAELRASPPRAGVPPDVVVAISAAVAAYLGKRAKVKQVHYRTGAAWAQQGRVAVQGHEIPHGVR